MLCSVFFGGGQKAIMYKRHHSCVTCLRFSPGSALNPASLHVETGGGGGLKRIGFDLRGRRVEGRYGGVRRFRSLPSHSQRLLRRRVRKDPRGSAASAGRRLSLYPAGAAAASAGSLGRGLRSCKGSRMASLKPE